MCRKISIKLALVSRLGKVSFVNFQINSLKYQLKIREMKVICFFLLYKVKVGINDRVFLENKYLGLRGRVG